MGTRYYRNDASRGRVRKGQFTREDIVAINDPDPNTGNRPFAQISTTIDPAKHIPTIGSGEEVINPHNGQKHWMSSVASALGVHPHYAEHVFDSYLNWDDGGYDGPIADSLRETQDGYYQDKDGNKVFGIDPQRKRSFDRHVEKLRKAPEFSPETLFVDKPNKVTVGQLFADPTMTTQAMTLGAISMDSNAVSKVTPDDSLSQYSSRLVNHAKKFGLIEDNPLNADAEQTNNIPKRDLFFEPGDIKNRGKGKINIPSFGDNFTEIPENEVFRAQQIMRQRIRGGRSKRSPKMSNQFDVPLPGMENF